MTNQWRCHFKKVPEVITVGEPLLLACDGETPVSFKKEKLFIRFLQPENKYKLHVLEVAHLDSLSAELLVTSYRTGDFQESFFITDGEREVFVEGLQFSVKSLLPQSPLSPHPPFGPWSTSLPLFYFTLWGFVGILALLISALRIHFFVSRKKFLRKVEKRSVVHPSKVFAQTVRKHDEKKKDFIFHLEKTFKLFLENNFFIQAENKNPKQIIRSLKKYCPTVYKKYMDKLFQVLGEFQYFQEKTPGEEECFKLKQTCFNLVFEMDQER
ncbi:MAG: hypothetical protein OXB86_05880 [Bdellovibrionales bacterium]|nr:hypothetical protein [Bdellovibrionales bacterium]